MKPVGEGGTGAAPLVFSDHVALPFYLAMSRVYSIFARQGLDDKVVPPAVSQEVVESLKKKNLTHEYHEYANEGHGFKMAATKIDSLTRETAFFARIINAESS